jgi:hypothetical protein
MKPKPTIEERAERLARDQLRSMLNKVKIHWSMSHIKTFEDLLHTAGLPKDGYYPAELSHPLTYDEVKSWLSDKQIELDTYFWLKKNPPNTQLTDEEKATIEFRINPAEGLHPVLSEAIRLEKEPKVSFDVAQELAAAEYAKRLPNLKRRKAFLFWFQKKAIVELIDNVQQGLPVSMLIAPTGAGKTYIAGDFICWLLETRWTQGKTFTPWPIVYVTKTSVVEQTRRVLASSYGITEEECLVINIEQLRSVFGQHFLKEETYVEDGIEHTRWIWRKNLKPACILWDECQSVKNDYSTQHKIALSYSEDDNKMENFQVFISASPGTRVSEFKCFCIGSRVPYTYGIMKDAPLTAEHWKDFAANIASDYGKSDIEPEQHSPAAIERLMNYMDKYIVRVKGIRWQFKAFNSIRMINFETEAGRKQYEGAWEEFQKKKGELENATDMTASQATFNILAQLQVFLKAAETNDDRINIITRDMHAWVTEGYAACAAVRFKLTICKCVATLINKFGVKRNQISLIWGGAPIATKKQKVKSSMMSNQSVLDALAEQGITLDDIDMDEIEAADEIETYPKEWKLGPQNAKQRQEEIDRYQKGISLYCFYTFRAGGVGLSLHHTDEWTTQKVRRKESGYALEEDIANIPTRPRRNIVAPTWSAIELVQGVGRCPRLTSLSHTKQELVFFRGTVEERQARVVGMKLHCLTKVVRNPESWEDMIIGRKGMTDEQVERAHLIDAGDTAQKLKQEEENAIEVEGIQIEEEDEE